MKKLVSDVADIHNVDVNVYDLDGNLQFYHRRIFMKKVFLPHSIFSFKPFQMKSTTENISDISYLSIYAPCKKAMTEPNMPM